MSMPCNCHPIQPPPPFDVPPPPDPSFVFHLLSDDPPEAFEKLHFLHSCPLQKHLFFFRSSLSRFLPLAVVAALLLFTSFSITAFVFWRKRRRTRRMGGMGEETDGREWKRKSEERKSERKAEKEEGGKKRRKARAKRRMSTLSGNTPPNAVPPPSVRLQTHFNIHFPVSSPSSDPDANFSRRSSTETVSSVPSPPQIAGDEWPFHQSATVKSAEVNIGSNASHRAPTVAFATPPRRSVALRLLPNHRLSPDFVWRSSSDCAPSNDLYEELAVTEGDIAEAPYKWRRTLTPSVSARRLPPPSSKPPPPPTEYPTDWPTSAVAYSFANENPNAEMDRQQNNQPTMKAENYTNKSRWRTSADFLDKEKESGYGTGRSGRRERNQLNATNDKKCCSSATIVQPTSFSPLSNVLIHSQPNAMSNTKKIDHISIIPNLAEEKEKCNESQPKTMTYL